MPLPAAVSSLPLRLPSHPLHLARPRAPFRRGLVRALDGQESPSPEAPPPPGRCSCCTGRGRRSLLLGAGGPLLAFASPPQRPEARAGGAPAPDPMVLTGGAGFANRRWRPEWYDEFYAKVMHGCMGRYESMIESYKSEIFKLLGKMENKVVLEMGVGTGPNLKYYSGTGNARVYGVDPNKEMEKYAWEAAVSSGLPPENFSFLRGFAEDLPVEDNSMDVVIGTLVLCSVSDVDASLREVKRVLKPGGIYIFIEHVAAQDGSSLRLIQTILDPLQRFVADGCHLARQTGKNISDAGFSDAQINMTSIPKLFIFGPHVYGFAHK